jgi:PAS domain S-box-containing protein
MADKTKEEPIEDTRLLKKRVAELEVEAIKRKKAEKAVKEAHEYAESVVATVREPLLVLDAGLKIISANKAFYNNYQVGPKETEGQFIYDLGNRQWDIPKLRKLLEDILPKNASFSDFEVRHNFPKIGERVMLLNARRIPQPPAKPRIILLAFEDITERKKLERSLEQALLTMSSRQRAILAAIPDIVAEVNKNKAYTWANQPGLEFFGEDMIGKEAAFYFEGKQDVYEAIQPIFEGADNTIRLESWQRRKDGEKRLLSWCFRALKDYKGVVTAVLSTARDITEHKKIEEEIKTATEVKSKFISTVSHELRSPLGAIKEGINIVLEGLAGNINNEQKDLLNVAKRNTDRLSRLINDVLDFQKIETGKMELRTSENDINEVALEVHKVMGILAKEKGLDLVVEPDDSIPRIRFNRDKIVQALTNLVDNAIKFTVQGSVSIRTLKEKEAAHIMVQDTGPGIKSEDIKKLFQPFEQLASLTERRTEGGTGLGLAISKDIIFAHKGRIWADSKVGEGSVFHFTLPIKE